MRRADIARSACSSSVDLPMPGSPPSSTTAPGDEPAAEHAIEFADAGGERGFLRALRRRLSAAACRARQAR